MTPDVSNPLGDAELDALLAAFDLKDERRTGWQLRGVDDPESVAGHTWGVAYLCLALGDRFAAELPSLDVDRALRLAVVHDLAEAETGDVPTRAADLAESGDDPDETDETTDDETADDVESGGNGEAGGNGESDGNGGSDGERHDEAAAEREAMDDLAGPLPDDVRDAWDEYEVGESLEAIVVKECDLLDMCLQALAYERADRYDPDSGEPDAFAEYDALDEFFATAEPRLRTDVGRGVFERVRDRYQRAREGY